MYHVCLCLCLALALTLCASCRAYSPSQSPAALQRQRPARARGLSLRRCPLGNTPHTDTRSPPAAPRTPCLARPRAVVRLPDAPSTHRATPTVHAHHCPPTPRKKAKSYSRGRCTTVKQACARAQAQEAGGSRRRRLECITKSFNKSPGHRRGAHMALARAQKGR
jgi:hypothetical protein